MKLTYHELKKAGWTFHRGEWLYPCRSKRTGARSFYAVEFSQARFLVESLPEIFSGGEWVY